MSLSLESYGEEGSGLARFEAHAMGTINVLLLAGDDARKLREAAQEAFETLERLEQSLSKFLPTSDVTLLNMLGCSRPVKVGHELLKLLELSREAWEITGGAFDPTIGALMEAWGLVDMEGKIPGPGELREVLGRSGMGHVHIDSAEGTAWFDRPGVSVDLGAIGKGYAVDRITSVLRERGITSGSFSSGRSSVMTLGAPPGETNWRLELIHPVDGEEPLGHILVEPGSISSSGAYARRFIRGGKEYGHVIDPRTGEPARALLGATLWTESAILGDVLSTALFVLGKSAVMPGGCARRLVEAWTPSGREARASMLLLEPHPGVWGGLRMEAFHIGRPGIRLEAPNDSST